MFVHQLDKLYLALGVAVVIASPVKTRARGFPFFRENFAVKPVEPLAFEFQCDIADCVGKRIAGGFPAQIRYGFVQSPAKISAVFLARPPLLVFINQSASGGWKFAKRVCVCNFRLSHTDLKPDRNFRRVKFAGSRRQFRELLFHFLIVVFNFTQIFAYLLDVGERHSPRKRSVAIAAGAQIKAFGKLINLMSGLRRSGEPPQNGFGRVPFAAVIFAFRFHALFTVRRAYPLCSARLTIETIICPARVSREIWAFLIDG